MLKKSMADRNFRIFPPACFPPDVVEPLVEIVATTERIHTNGVEIEDPPERMSKRSRKNWVPYRFTRLTQSSTSS